MQVPKILGERQRDGMRGRTKFMGRKTVRRLLQHGFGVPRSNTNKTSRTGAERRFLSSRGGPAPSDPTACSKFK
jgi:hypothetical protein